MNKETRQALDQWLTTPDEPENPPIEAYEDEPTDEDLDEIDEEFTDEEELGDDE